MNTKEMIAEAIENYLELIYTNEFEMGQISPNVDINYFMDWDRYDRGLDLLASAVADALNDAHNSGI